LSSFDGARQLAQAVLAGHQRLDLFISNAGIGSRSFGSERRTSLRKLSLALTGLSAA
jgi:NAD(P)-dependent dehydrogenase (short-subunit alcohol dehydrogenase family)